MSLVSAINLCNQYQTKHNYIKLCKKDFDRIIDNDKNSQQQHTVNFFLNLAEKSGVKKPEAPIELYAGQYLIHKKPIPLSLIQKTAQYMADEKKQILDDDTYFIRMQKYDRCKTWAYSMNGLTYILSYMVFSKKSFEELIKLASYQLNIINDNNVFFGKERNKAHVFTIFENEKNRGDEYFEKYKNRCFQKPRRIYIPSSNQEYKNADVCSIEYSKSLKSITIEHQKPEEEQKNLLFASKEYNKLLSIDNPDEDTINRSIATIHWLIAQQMPYKRGSDSVANLITKAIYHAYNMKITPAKKGHSFDFEAFYRNLDDFIKIYPDLFEQSPHKIKD